MSNNIENLIPESIKNKQNRRGAEKIKIIILITLIITLTIFIVYLKLTKSVKEVTEEPLVEDERPIISSSPVFASYQEISVDVDPKVPSYSINQDLSNVSNINDFNFSSKAKELIAKHFDYLRTFSQAVFTIFEEKVILAQGELLSTAMFQLYLEEMGESSVLLPALDFMKIDKNAEPDMAFITENLNQVLAENPGKLYYITQGYICRNFYGEIDNLQRGGSDYTASLIGAAIKAEEIQIWTDIDGLHNNDPRYVEGTKPVRFLNFDEAAELAYFGAKILHPTCILPAKLNNIPVRLLDVLEPQLPVH